MESRRLAPVDLSTDKDVAVVGQTGIGVQHEVTHAQLHFDIGLEKDVRTARALVIRYDGEIRRIQKQGSKGAVWRPKIGQTRIGQVLSAGHFDKSAVAAGVAAPRRDVAFKGGGQIGPDRNPTAVSGVKTIRSHDRGCIHRDGFRCLKADAAPEIAANPDGSAADVAAGVDVRAIKNDLCTGDRDFAAGTGCGAHGFLDRRVIVPLGEGCLWRRAGRGAARHGHTSAIAAAQNDHAIAHAD